MIFLGRCGGIATNFLVSISSHQDCLDACNRDDRCCDYSHHKGEAAHPDHNTCYLFSSGECDMEDLMIDVNKRQWRTGKRTTVSRQCKRYPRRFG